MPASIYSLHYDILLAIFHELSLHVVSGPDLFRWNRDKSVSDTERRIRRLALASAALVCRAFADPATEVLWSVFFDGKMQILLELLSVCKRARDDEDHIVFVSHLTIRHGRITTLTTTGL